MRPRIRLGVAAAGVALVTGLLTVGCTSQIAGTAEPGAGAGVATTTTTTRSAAPTASPSPLLERLPFVGPGFAIQAPLGWTVDRSGTLGADVILRNPRPDPIATGSFAANINVLSPPASGSLETVVASVKAQIKAQVPDLQVIDDGPATTTSGMVVYLYGGTFTQRAQLPDQLHDLRLIAVAGNTAYVASGTALAATYAGYEAAIRASLLSFTAR